MESVLICPLFIDVCLIASCSQFIVGTIFTIKMPAIYGRVELGEAARNDQAFRH